MNKKDLYEILGISKNSTQKEIKRKFVELVKNNHPDQGGDPEKFKEIVEANEILSDPEKRQMYDQHGFDGFQNGGGSGFDPNMDDIFASFFGGRGHPGMGNQKAKLRPIIEYVNVSLEEIYNGAQKSVSVKKQTICSSCKGKGGKNVKKCMPCKGSGVQTKMTQFGPGMYGQTQAPCGSCHGTGEHIEQSDVCNTCYGQKIIQKTEKINFTIQKGMTEYHQLKMPGAGNQHPSYHPGDLIIQINATPHPVFSRKGDDLYCKVTISLSESLSGFKFNLTLLDKTCITVESSKGEIVKHKDMKMIDKLGFPKVNNPNTKGDLFIEFNVEYPSSLQDEQLQKLKEILPPPIHKDIKESGKNYKMKKAVERNYDDYSYEQESENPNQGVGCQSQ